MNFTRTADGSVTYQKKSLIHLERTKYCEEAVCSSPLLAVDLLRNLYMAYEDFAMHLYRIFLGKLRNSPSFECVFNSYTLEENFNLLLGMSTRQYKEMGIYNLHPWRKVLFV